MVRRADGRLAGSGRPAHRRVRPREGRVSAPLLPLRVILDRTRAGAYLSVGVAAIALFGAFLFLTYYLQTIKGYGPVTAGLAFLPRVGGLLVSANVSSNVLLPRIGPRIMISSGLPTSTAAKASLTHHEGRWLQPPRRSTATRWRSRSPRSCSRRAASP